MKTARGFSIIGAIIGIIVVIIILVGAFFVIDGNNKATDYNNYDFYSVIESTKDNGNIGDHVKGDAGIVVRFGVNEPVTETFRLLRTNVLFMLKGEGNAILVTSSTSG